MRQLPSAPGTFRTEQIRRPLPFSIDGDILDVSIVISLVLSEIRLGGA